jgi:hypothetical protein
MPEEFYKTKINLEEDEVYDKINLWLDEHSYRISYTSQGVEYFLDKERAEVARMNLEDKTLELNDKVKQDIIDKIGELM